MPGVFKTLILFFAANPDLGLIWISYSWENATDNPVGTRHDLPGSKFIGFAAETNNLANYANKKLNEKNCDWIVANDVSNKKIGFDSNFNEVSIFYRNNKTDKLKYKPKSEISDELVEKIIDHLN